MVKLYKYLILKSKVYIIKILEVTIIIFLKYFSHWNLKLIDSKFLFEFIIIKVIIIFDKENKKSLFKNIVCY